jgi:predicted transcriptional regulator
MSRPRQNPEAIRKDRFRAAVGHGQVDAGLMSKKDLAEAAGIPYTTLWKRLEDPDKMTVEELKKLLSAVHIDPGAVLLLVGYSHKEILRVVDHTA